jgi:NDP-sugar pyrophosphorylase family protein
MRPPEAIILAGGKGTRLQESVKDRPKPLAEVAGRPFIEWLLLMLFKQGVRRVIVCTGHMGEMIESQLGSGIRFNLELSYVRDPIPLGTGGAVRNALALLHTNSALVLNGDSYFRFDAKSLQDFHAAHRAETTILLTKVEDASRFGTVDVEDTGEVKAFREKTSGRHSAWINAGIYLVNRGIIESIPENQSVSLEREVFPGLIGKGLYGKLENGLFWDIGTVDSYKSSTDILSGEFAELDLHQKRDTQ